jgi:hypothetical protein
MKSILESMADEFAELEEIPEPSLGDTEVTAPGTYNADGSIASDMVATGAWYFKKKKVLGPKYLALGRTRYYDLFAARMSKALGSKFYLFDYMDRPYGGLAYDSIKFYLRTAERIDICLEGVSFKNLRDAISYKGLAPHTVIKSSAEGREGKIVEAFQFPYTLSWEINQVYKGGHLAKTWWHYAGSPMSAAEVAKVLGRKVPRDRITA